MRMPRRALGTRMTPSTGHSFSCANGSSSTARSNGASRIRVRLGTRTPAFAAMAAASLPTMDVSNRPSGNRVSRTRSRSSSLEQVRSVPAHLAKQPVGDGLLDDQDALVRAEHRVVERLAGDQLLGRPLQVGGRVDEHRHVAGTDADRRVAGRVGRAHDTDPTGGEDDVGALVGHQRVDQRDRRRLDDLDHTVRCTGRDRCLSRARGRRRCSTPARAGCGLITTALRVSSASSTLK